MPFCDYTTCHVPYRQIFKNRIDAIQYNAIELTFGALKCAINAVLNILTKIAADGVRAPEAPTVPKLGRRAATLSAPKVPLAAYALPRYRIVIARAVYIIPKLPTKENGAKEDRFFIRQSGKRTAPVKPRVTGILVEATPTVDSKLTNVSPRIIEYAKHAQTVLKVTAEAGNQLLDFETVALQASRYDFVLV